MTCRGVSFRVAWCHVGFECLLYAVVMDVVFVCVWELFFHFSQ
jgi:hypothetical protein